MGTPDPRFHEEDFQPEKKTRFDEFMDLVNDNEARESLEGHPPSELGEGESFNYHQDTYHPRELSRLHSDEELEKVIKELLRNSKRVDARDITVSVDNCNVKLSGSVHSQFERDYAGSVVKLVHGVGEVNSELIVKTNPGILPTDIGRNPG
jgi:osmotically-inducible protein OsmY